MRTNIITALAVAFLPIAAFAQTPAAPPVPPVPPVPAVPPAPPVPGPHDRGPKVPVTYLGVETSGVPNVVSEQLGLAKGFGLVVDYVVPDGPAAAAGMQPNDIIKMFNDQILTEPDQLAKLVRSNAEGATVTLTVLRKGTETKLTAKLAKREVPQRPGWDGHGRHGSGFGAIDFGNMNEQMKHLNEGLGDMKLSFGDSAMEGAREQVAQAREAAREGARAAREGAREAARQAREAAREFRVTQREHGAVKTTRIDMGKAQIIYHDQQGELKIESVDGKKVLTAKDPQGRLVFSGPVGTKEELDKAPADVRQRYEKLEQKDLPNVVPPNVFSQATVDAEAAADAAADADDSDEDDNDADADDDNSAESVMQVSFDEVKSVPYRNFGINSVII